MDNRYAFLHAILPIVPFEGWTEHAMREAATSLRLDSADVKKIFPGGVTDVIRYFFAQADDALSEQYPGNSLLHLRVHERIETLVLSRLQYMLPTREAVRRALAHLALPWNAWHGTQALYHSVDRMWQLAGDQSTDYNFYTKRALLAGVYSSTVLFWLNDTSDHQHESATFLKRRLGDVAKINQLKKKFSPSPPA